MHVAPGGLQLRRAAGEAHSDLRKISLDEAAPRQPESQAPDPEQLSSMPE